MSESNPLGLPWKPRTRQMQGMSSEAATAKRVGARLHPRSGAGNIKWDASDQETVYEMKNVKRTHTLNGEYMKRLLLDAIRQGKSASYHITFEDAGIEVECRMAILPKDKRE